MLRNATILHCLASTCTDQPCTVHTIPVWLCITSPILSHEDGWQPTNENSVLTANVQKVPGVLLADWIYYYNVGLKQNLCTVCLSMPPQVKYTDGLCPTNSLHTETVDGICWAVTLHISSTQLLSQTNPLCSLPNTDVSLNLQKPTNNFKQFWETKLCFSTAHLKPETQMLLFSPRPFLWQEEASSQMLTETV